MCQEPYRTIQGQPLWGQVLLIWSPNDTDIRCEGPTEDCSPGLCQALRKNSSELLCFFSYLCPTNFSFLFAAFQVVLTWILVKTKRSKLEDINHPCHHRITVLGILWILRLGWLGVCKWRTDSIWRQWAGRREPEAHGEGCCLQGTQQRSVFPILSCSH